MPALLVLSITHGLYWQQTLPVERGRGMDQPGMRAAEQRLNAGEWVHIFPEGTRSADGTSMVRSSSRLFRSGVS